MMSSEFDYIRFYERLTTELRESAGLGESVAAMTAFLSESLVDPEWPSLARLDGLSEIQRARRWIAKVTRESPCPFQVRGLYCGLSEFSGGAGRSFADLYLGLLGTYDPGDPGAQWLYQEPRHFPSDGHLRSEPLRHAGLFCTAARRRKRLGTDAFVAFSLAFASLLLRHALDARVHAVLGGTDPIGVAVGFDSGDVVRLGELTSSGLRLTAGPMI